MAKGRRVEKKGTEIRTITHVGIASQPIQSFLLIFNWRWGSTRAKKRLDGARLRTVLIPTRVRCQSGIYTLYIDRSDYTPTRRVIEFFSQWYTKMMRGRGRKIGKKSWMLITTRGENECIHIAPHSSLPSTYSLFLVLLFLSVSLFSFSIRLYFCPISILHPLLLCLRLIIRIVCASYLNVIRYLGNYR